MSRWRRAVQAVLTVNNLVPLPPPPARLALPETCPPRPRARPTKPDRVLVLGSAGVLVTSKGRLPRDGEVEHDGVALRIACKGGPVLVAGALRRVPVGCRWVPVAQLHRVDLAVVAAAAPAHLVDMRKRERVDALIGQLAAIHGKSTGDAERDLQAVLALTHAHAQRRA